MRYLAIAVSVVFLMAAAGVGAAPISQAPGLASATPSMLELIQAKKKSETVTQKIKRVWRSWTDHQFCARCPLIISLTASTCSVKTGITGRPSRDEARATRATCVARNPLCYVNDGPC